MIKEPDGPLIFFDTVASSCLFWNETTEQWSHEGCEVHISILNRLEVILMVLMALTVVKFIS